MNNVQENTHNSNNLHVIFTCVILVRDPHSSVSCLYLLNLGTVLIFVNYVGCCQAVGSFCIGYFDYGYSVLCMFVNLCILNVCFSCVYFNYFNVFSPLFSCILRSITCIQLLYKELPTFWTFYFFRPWLAAYSSVCFGFMLYYFVWFPDDGSLWTETCRISKHDIIIQIAKEQVCAFCWLSVVKLLSVNEQCKACLI